MIIGIVGAVVGEVLIVRPHPRGSFIWLADVDPGTNSPAQIVFGGNRKLRGGELIPVAPPGSRVLVQREDSVGQLLLKKMRIRKYRGERSHGMLCSLDELGLTCGGPNEVAILRNLTPGQNLDILPMVQWPEVILDWERVKQMEKREARATPIAEVDSVLEDAIARPRATDGELSPGVIAYGC